jgi:hypothetical protein
MTDLIDARFGKEVKNRGKFVASLANARWPYVEQTHSRASVLLTLQPAFHRMYHVFGNERVAWRSN